MVLNVANADADFGGAPSHSREEERSWPALAALSGPATAENFLTHSSHNERLAKTYSAMPAIQYASNLLRDALESIAESIHPGDPGRAEQFALNLEGVVAHAALRYPHADQFHSLEHMLTVVTYSLHLAQLNGSSLDERGAMRLVAGAAYHDAGNQRSPRPGGADEVSAVRQLIYDWSMAEPGSALSVLEPADIVRCAADIAGTVFPDRFASASTLAVQPYVKDIAILLRANDRIGTLFTGAANLIESTLARMMLEPEAMTLKHADLSGSLTADNAFKTYVMNRFEDQRAGKPGIKDSTDPGAYQQGFATFLQGVFHIVKFPNDCRPDNVTLMRALQMRQEETCKTFSTWGVSDQSDPKIVIDVANYAVAISAGNEVTAVLTRFGIPGTTPEDLPAAARAVGDRVRDSLVEFSNAHGFRPTIFPGMRVAEDVNDPVGDFGRLKLQASNVTIQGLVERHPDLMRAFHTVANKFIDLPALSLAEVRKELFLADPSLESSGRYDTLIALSGPEAQRTFAATPPQELNRIFFPAEEPYIGLSGIADEIFCGVVRVPQFEMLR